MRVEGGLWRDDNAADKALERAQRVGIQGLRFDLHPVDDQGLGRDDDTVAEALERAQRVGADADPVDWWAGFRACSCCSAAGHGWPCVTAAEGCHGGVSVC